MTNSESRSLAPEEEIDLICDSFESALRAGSDPDPREYLDRIGESLRGRLLIELLQAELEVRHLPRADLQARYQQQFPEFAAAIEAFSLESALEKTTPFDRGHASGVAPRRSFARFELEELVGVGAVGEVWRAYDPRLERHVALKIPRHSFVSTDEARRFLREGRAAAQLRHPNIVQVHEVAREGDDVYIVSDYLEGGDLRAYLDASPPDFRVAASLCAAIAGALHYAHDCGIIHRDLKPANVLMDSMARPHVTDFGLAKWTKEAAQMTATGEVLGTPAYMSPEQASGRAAAVDRRCDVYAVGVMLYEMLTGRLPFSGDLPTVLRAIGSDPPPHPRSIRRDIPRDLATICLKAMEKDPVRRYATAFDLAADLQRFLVGESIIARPVSPPERLWRWCRRHPAAAASLLLCAALVAAGVASVRERARWRQAGDIREVSIDTMPSGAEVVFVPLHNLSGLPDPDRMIHGGYSPVRLSLAPGDYLVVAAHENGMFHEVPRHVPRSDEGLAGGANTVFFSMSADGVIHLPMMQLWSNSDLKRMVAVDIALPDEPAPSELLIDHHEMIGSELPKDGSEQPVPDAAKPFQFDYYRAQMMAESGGKRLPTAPEFQALQAAAERNPDLLQGLFSEPWEWTSTSATVESMTGNAYIGPNELSNTAMLFGGSASEPGRAVEKYGGETAALRAVRSLRPRLRPEDFSTALAAPASLLERPLSRNTQ